MALGLAAATITGGLLVQPRNTDQDLAATPKRRVLANRHLSDDRGLDVDATDEQVPDPGADTRVEVVRRTLTPG